MESHPERDPATGGRRSAAGVWEHFPHGADVGIRGIGPDRATAFAQAARALTASICDPDSVAPAEALELECSARDDEFLLVEWIDMLVYEMATRGMLFARFDVRVTDHRLKATVHGESIDVARHQPAVEVKGATLTGLRVYRDRRGQCVAECIVDV